LVAEADVSARQVRDLAGTGTLERGIGRPVGRGQPVPAQLHGSGIELLLLLRVVAAAAAETAERIAGDPYAFGQASPVVGVVLDCFAKLHGRSTPGAAVLFPMPMAAFRIAAVPNRQRGKRWKRARIRERIARRY